ncbi:MAG: succinylglutamate desuccinylase/aspartoacylase family protein [Marinobacter sp.]|nr:succinylglutamate desuccinylase/aspartoacylase family protein [Marinobacter sp.]
MKHSSTALLLLTCLVMGTGQAEPVVDDGAPRFPTLPMTLTTAETSDTAKRSLADASPEVLADELVGQLLQPVPAPQAEPLSLLGATLAPGGFMRIDWSPDVAIAGLNQPTPVLAVNGREPGPTLCLTAAIHGDELNGIEIVRRVVYDIDPEELSGRVIGVPIVNIQGFERGSRYLPDRRDLNRNFPGSPDGSLAARLAYSLFENIIRHCDMLVDIHTGSLNRTNLPQLRADLNIPAVAAFTRGFDNMTVIHSTGGAGMLRTAAVDAGIVAVTMEAGESLRIQQRSIADGVHSILALMENEGMIARLMVMSKPRPVYAQSAWIRVSRGGILFSKVELGDEVLQGQLLGHVVDPITNDQHPVTSTRDGRIIGMAVDQVVMAGFAAYHIGFQPETNERPSQQPSAVIETFIAPDTVEQDGDYPL